MKKNQLSVVIFLAVSLLVFTSCDDSGGDTVDEATSLGETLVLSGEVTGVFVPEPTSYTAGYVGTENFSLLDESDTDVSYQDDANDTEDDEVNVNYVTDVGELELYSSAIWPGISSSNTSAQLTSAIIGVRDVTPSYTGNDIIFGNFKNFETASSVEMYYYMYSTEETILDGTYVDTDSDHVYNNLKLFPGWNRMIKSTTDGDVMTYKGGEIDDGEWTYVDNS